MTREHVEPSHYGSLERLLRSHCSVASHSTLILRQSDEPMQLRWRRPVRRDAYWRPTYLFGKEGGIA